MPFLYKLRRYKWYVLGRRKIKRQIHALGKAGEPIKVNIGAGPSTYDGWLGTDLPHFNILRDDHWEYFFGNFKVDKLLSEHVLEHLTPDQVKIVFTFAFQYMAPNGNFRIAVPEKNHPDPDYINFVKPGGYGPGADDHKSFWNLEAMSELAKSIGFEVVPIEYYDAEGNFHYNEFTDDDGCINRSGGRSKEFWPKTSLIIDLKKS